MNIHNKKYFILFKILLILVIIISLYYFNVSCKIIDKFNDYKIINLEEFEEKIYSQNGEDGITMKLIELIYDNPKNKIYVEFGVENGNECNTRILRENYQWQGLLMDGSYENNDINLKKEYITQHNIIDLLRKYNIPNNINLLCVDIDYNDFYILKEILSKFICDIIICEYNATHLPDEDKIVIYEANTNWDGTNYFGASLLSFKKLANLYNYSLVYCNKNGVNCFFVNNDIIKNKNLKFNNIDSIEKIYRKSNYGTGPNDGHTQDLKNRIFISFDEAIQK
jgi:hypothetical protein